MIFLESGNKQIMVIGYIDGNEKIKRKTEMTIRSMNPDIVLLQHFKSLRLRHGSDAAMHLNNRRSRQIGIVTPENEDFFKLARALNKPFYGIDLEFEVNQRYDYRKYIGTMSPNYFKSLPPREQVRLREQNMLGVIEEVVNDPEFNKVVIILDDIHLRVRPTPEMGDPSKITEYCEGRNDCHLVRAPRHLRDIE